MDTLDSSLVATTPSVSKGTIVPDESVITGVESPRTVRSRGTVRIWIGVWEKAVERITIPHGKFQRMGCSGRDSDEEENRLECEFHIERI